MNEKNRIFVFTCVVMLFAGITACKSTDVIGGNTYATGRLEATIAELDRTVASSRKRIENIIGTGRNIEDGIERLEYLFEQYESEVGRLLSEIDRIRNETEESAEQADSVVGDSGNGGAD